MAALTEHVRVVVKGTAPDGEIFNFGFWGGPPAPVASQGDLQDMVGELVNTFVDGPLPYLRSMVDSGFVYTGLSAYYYATGSQTAATFSAEGVIATTDGTGTSTQPPKPLQTCLVASLRTQLPGRANRGRAYVPAGNVLMTAEHQADDTVTVNLSNALADWLSMWQTDGSINMIAVAVSKVHQTAYALTAVQVDSRCDVQRRRANKQAAHTSHSAAVVVG
jgi:hypothetical protein